MRIASLSDYLLLRVNRDPSAQESTRIPRGARVPRVPANRQIYQLIREAILAQTLPAGLQLPSTRDLAGELGMSRNTVTYAYEQLLAEGYLESRAGAGTFVADTAPDQIPETAERHIPLTDPSGKSELSARGAMLTRQAGVSDKQWGAFMPGIPDVTQFPHKVWSRLQNKHWRRAQAEMLTYGPGAGYGPLREAIAEYLRISRSVNCNASQVMITSGIHQSLDTVVKLLGEHGDSAWVEDPCYWGTRSVLNSLGIQAVPIPVDQEGMRMRLANLRRPPRFICTTPSHQYPLGMVMSLSRRRMLLEYAAAHKVWIIEDDYDSEFRYGGRPLASLQGMDTHNRVLYMGTFSKIMFPGLRIGFLVVPEALAGAFATGLAELYRGGQVFLQATLADFMAEGHFSSHIRKMRVLYAERLQLLQQAIQRNFGDDMHITGGEAGLHLTISLPPQCDDKLICADAWKDGVIVRPLSTYYMTPKTARCGLLLGYASVPNEMIRPAFDKLAQIIRNAAID
ncbi:PLP-dependent aminotransferase family protein [Herbaspirillum sp. RV1423]|uniref:MocR-like pyridoxine biosynthesis transcription factor PdxR n=1 Tax=Herbaspirillum sp. RV1423 TaxID=1443993 RepID=UPI0004B2CEC3|nr:PLP-dependent aminotransferase family protein [Herbaspirillum sp. RV1423]